MTIETLPRSTRWGSIAAVWILAAIAAVCIGVFSPSAQYSAWLALTLGGCTVVAFAVQLATQVTVGFVSRLAATLVGTLFILAIAAAVLWIVEATH